METPVFIKLFYCDVIIYRLDLRINVSLKTYLQGKRIIALVCKT